MEDWLYRLAGNIALAIEMIAIVVVAYGSAAALIGIVRVMLARGSKPTSARYGCTTHSG